MAGYWTVASLGNIFVFLFGRTALDCTAEDRWSIVQSLHFKRSALTSVVLNGKVAAPTLAPRPNPSRAACERCPIATGPLGYYYYYYYYLPAQWAIIIILLLFTGPLGYCVVARSTRSVAGTASTTLTPLSASTRRHNIRHKKKSPCIICCHMCHAQCTNAPYAITQAWLQRIMPVALQVGYGILIVA